jgi:hypothetical protein
MVGSRKKLKLEKHRVETLSSITGERVNPEAMAQRPRSADDVLDTALLDTVIKRLTEIEAAAQKVESIDDLDDLAADAEQQGQFSAYFCPVTDIRDEGELLIDLIDGWGIPKAATKKLRELFAKKIEKADANPEAARTALHFLFAERDAWAEREFEPPRPARQ